MKRDIRDVRRGLKCIIGNDEINVCEGCPYFDSGEECDVLIAKDALELIGDDTE